ncbi:unnamed protein product [Adineta steineri]|uniref:Uncharacterized protein n=1 Tax=Adineta steineri TaxID=433720 RepID=A0A813VUQ6_9BILA|nr:unnamed protein product [Adineta steineri]CAF1360789.1 unnamed protein product [Adineta steineri]
MSYIKLKSSLGSLWYQIGCFLIEIYCHISNLGLIRYYDSSIDDKSKDFSLIICLIIVAFTIVSSSISTVCNFLNGFSNSIEDYSFDFSKYKKSAIFYLPYLSICDIYIAILILLPKLIIHTQLIKAKIKDQSFIFESSIDFLIGSGLKRVKKDDILFVTNDTNSIASCEIINLFLLLIRYNYNYLNFFYKLNKRFNFISSIHSLITIILILLIYSIFEILFKQISFINNSINGYSYLILLSLFISILFILLTNHALFHFVILNYFQQQYQISNQLIRLSNLDDRYLIEKPLSRSLIYYFLFVIISILCQFPLIIYSIKSFLSGLIDKLIIIYIIILLFYFLISILLFTFLYYYPLLYWNLHNLNENFILRNKDNQSISSMEYLHKSNRNLEDNLYHIETPHLIPTRSVSSCGLTVIERENANIGIYYNPTYQQTSRVATDTLLVMH